jgi:hypothetical protein
MGTVAIVDWSLSHRAPIDTNVTNNTYCPKVTGPKGGRLKIYAAMYHDGTMPAHYPVPAIPYRIGMNSGGFAGKRITVSRHSYRWRQSTVVCDFWKDEIPEYAYEGVAHSKHELTQF